MREVTNVTVVCNKEHVFEPGVCLACEVERLVLMNVNLQDRIANLHEDLEAAQKQLTIAQAALDGAYL